MKQSRAERDWGLPALTLAEAARVLGISPAAFRDWLAADVKHTSQMWTNWNAEGAHFPEALIRLYLTRHLPSTEEVDQPPESSRATPPRRQGSSATTTPPPLRKAGGGGLR